MEKKRRTSVPVLALSFAFAATFAQADMHTFTNGTKTADNWYHLSNTDNWLNESGEHELPVEGDEAVFERGSGAIAATCTAYLKSVTIKNGFGCSFAWNGFYIKEGGAGLVYEGVGNLNPTTAFYLDGTVNLHLVGNMSYSSTGNVNGRSDTQKGRFVKTGPGTLAFNDADKNFTGGTIREGVFAFKAFTGASNADFCFDGSASSAYLELRGDLTLPSGGLTSTADLPKMSHGVKDSGNGGVLSLTVLPKERDEYFAGSFTGKSSFRFAPDSSDYTFTFARAVSDTQGGLVVENGEVILADGATFTSLTGLVVRAGAKLTVESGAGRDFSARELVVESDSASVRLGAGVMMTAVGLKVAEKPVAPGLYRAGSGLPWLTGDGELLVMGSGGAPAEATWTGAGADDKVSTALNWDGGVTPDLDGGCVTATFATGGPTEMDRRAYFAGVILSNGFSFTGTEALLLGANGLRIADATAATTYTIASPLMAAANARYYVGTNTTLNLTGPIASVAGSVPTFAGSGAVNFKATSTTAVNINLNGDTLPAGATTKSPKPGVYTGEADNAFGGAGGTTFADLMASKLVFSGDQVQDRAFETRCAKNDQDYGISLKDGNITFNAKVEHKSNNLHLYLTRGKTATFNAELRTSSALYCSTSWGSSGYADVICNAHLHVGDRFGIPQWMRVTLNTTTNRINGNAGSQTGVIRCGCAYAIDYHNGSGGGTFIYPSGSFTLDLGGHDQGVGCIYARSNGGTITSETPATLHLRDDYMIPYYDSGLVDAAGNMIAAPGYTNYVVFTGCASFSKEGKYTNRLKRVSTTFGDLTVMKSRLEFAPEASWLNASNLIVKGTGLFTLDDRTSAQGQPFGKHFDVHVEGTSAKIELNNTIPMVVRDLYVDGVQQEESRYYGSSEAAAANLSLNVKVLPCFTGLGLLRARGIPGLMILLR